MANIRVALAIAAHPDDIEFCMAGTLLLLKQKGWSIHYLNIATGNCGSAEFNGTRTKRIRAKEAREAAKMLGATFHPSFRDDLEIFYDDRSLRRLAAVVREVKPTVVLTHSPEDYMEDHMNTSRLAVTASFARGMPNYRTQPLRGAITGAITVYHAMPHGLADGLGNPVLPTSFVNTSSVHTMKRAALACHRSQKEWLDRSQGMDSYLQSMDEMSLAIGKLSGIFQHAEGWRRHSHLGFCGITDDPLKTALANLYHQGRSKNKGPAQPARQNIS